MPFNVAKAIENGIGWWLRVCVCRSVVKINLIDGNLNECGHVYREIEIELFSMAPLSNRMQLKKAALLFLFTFRVNLIHAKAWQLLNKKNQYTENAKSMKRTDPFRSHLMRETSKRPNESTLFLSIFKHSINIHTFGNRFQANVCNERELLGCQPIRCV